MIGSVELEKLRRREDLSDMRRFSSTSNRVAFDQRDERAKRFNVLQFYRLKFTGVCLEYPSGRWQFAWDSIAELHRLLKHF